MSGTDRLFIASIGDDGLIRIWDGSPTLARWTIVIDRDGKLVSMRQVQNPTTDIEEVVKIVAGLQK